MKAIIKEALENLKHQIDCSAGEFAENGLSPQGLSKFVSFR